MDEPRRLLCTFASKHVQISLWIPVPPKWFANNRPSVREVLSETQVIELNDLLAKATDGIRNMAERASTAGEKSQAVMLEEIARKTPNVIFLSRGFNKAAVALLEKFDLPDERIVSPFIKNHPRFKKARSFADLLAILMEVRMPHRA